MLLFTATLTAFIIVVTLGAVISTNALPVPNADSWSVTVPAHRTTLVSEATDTNTVAAPVVPVTPNCHHFKKNITYIPEHLMRLPPLLLSIPGSGNTWVRLLIELSTGYYTGAIYDDLTLFEEFKGEKTCGLRTVVVKAHPLDVDVLPNLREIKIPGHHYKKKCSKGSITGFKRAIVLVREPYASILADSQNGLTLNHTGTLTKEAFAVHNETWQHLALRMSYRVENNSHNVLFPLLNSFDSKDILILRFEKLTNPLTRINELQRVLDFVGFPSIPGRLECAFQLSDADRNVHREKKITMNDTFAVFPELTCVRMLPYLKNFTRVFEYPNIFSDFCDAYLRDNFHMPGSSP